LLTKIICHPTFLPAILREGFVTQKTCHPKIPSPNFAGRICHPKNLLSKIPSPKLREGLLSLKKKTLKIPSPNFAGRICHPNNLSPKIPSRKIAGRISLTQETTQNYVPQNYGKYFSCKKLHSHFICHDTLNLRLQPRSTCLNKARSWMRAPTESR
jgi:hypothetical protein